MTQLIAPRYGQGRDFGTKRRMIAVEYNPDADQKNPSGTSLFIVGGHSSSMGARGFGRDYHPTALWLFYKHERFGWMQDKLATGRITRETLIQNAARIDSAFGKGVAHLLDPRDTAWIKDGAFMEDRA